MFTKIKEWKLYLEGKNGPTAGEEKKDLMRIYDIVDKANGDKAKEKQLAQLMADKITDISKAKRRADVADAEGHSHLASIFTKRYRELKKASKKNEDIDNGTSVKKITAADINPKDDNASTHDVPLAVKLHGKKLAKNESLVGNDYSTKNAERNDLYILMDLLDTNDIEYSLDGPGETIDFDITELDRGQQDQVLKLLNIKANESKK